MKREQKFIFLATMVVAVMTVSSAFAVTAPTTGSFAYDVYDLAVNKILNGPIGFVGGLAAVVLGGMMAVRNMILPAVGTILGGGMVIASDTIIQSMGAMII